MFEGRLEVTDREAFLDTIRKGIGSGKAYGFGLLTNQSRNRSFIISEILFKRNIINLDIVAISNDEESYE